MSSVKTALDRYEWAIPAVVLLVGIVLTFTRRPDALLNAQFYVEDGILWYAEAHEQGGWHMLLVPSYRGYIHALPRIGGLAAQSVPLAFAPLVMNSLAILSGALPAALIASKRFATVLPRVEARLLAALLYLGLPCAWGTIANMTHSQWHFALLAGLVVVAAPPETNSGRAFDLVVCLLSGLTGPTSIFLTPVAALAAWARRTPWSVVIAGVTAATAAVQAACIALTAAPHDGEAPLGASPVAFLNLFVRKIVLETFVGDAGNAWLAEGGRDALLGPAVLALVAAVAAVGLAVAVWWGSLELRLLMLFGGLVFLGTLARPPALLHNDKGWWEALAVAGNGNRYFMIPVFAILMALVLVAFSGSRPARIAGGAALAVALALGVGLNWREPPLRDYGFAQYVQKYERAEPGQRVQVVTPPGWSFILTKR